MITMGIDVGNLLCKVVVMEGDRVVARGVAPTTGNVASEIDLLVDGVLREAGLSRSVVDFCAATGSGSGYLEHVDFHEDALTCTAAAGAFLLPDINMVIDIGGQSITAILLDEDGDVVNFMRNDKCASGSGRFLEVMCAAVGVGVEMIDRVAASARSPVPISSQCGVFAESEVITHVNAGEDPADIVAGLCHAVANIVSAQARRFSEGDNYTITGSVAKIGTVTGLVSTKLGRTYTPFPGDPGLATAMGAAILAEMEAG